MGQLASPLRPVAAALSSDWQELLLQLYQNVNPLKLQNVLKLLAKYRGKEEVLLDRVIARDNVTTRRLRYLYGTFVGGRSY